ncbi:MAG: hypothetical protein WBI18_08280 [Candidatus Saccharicenans sp.]
MSTAKKRSTGNCQLITKQGMRMMECRLINPERANQPEMMGLFFSNPG